MMRGTIQDLFVGKRRTETREAALERLRWIAKSAVPESLAVGEARSILIAVPASIRPPSGAQDGLFEDRSDEERARIEVTIGDLTALPIASREFDVVILTPELMRADWQRSIERAWSRLRASTGRLLVLAEFQDTMTPSALVRMLRTLVQPIELFVWRGLIHFAAIKASPSFEAWQAVASKERLVEIAESAVLEIDAAWEEEVEGLIESAEESLRSTLIENDRLKDALDRKGSTRHQLASAFTMLQLPARLLEIYRMRRSLRTAANERSQEEGEELP